MTTAPEHISVCICTYKRPQMLLRCLQRLETQVTEGRFTYAVVIADNDAARSSEATVREFNGHSRLSVKYCVESRQGIARARNMAIRNASGDYLAFIDDDEFPGDDWLLQLYDLCRESNVDGVLGPVLSHFDDAPPQWLERSGFYKRRVGKTGSPVVWQAARTGNVLLKASVILPDEQPFRPEFRMGEDQDFFRRKIEQGHSFIWSETAAVYEVVPPARWRRSYLLRKALLRGASASQQPSCNAVSIVKSLLAVPAYALALPVALLLGQHRFMRLLVKLCDHLGKLLALAGVSLSSEQYVTE